MSKPREHPVVLGLGANAPQFILLVVVNGFVGAMVGLERTVLPLLARREFGVRSTTVALSFLVTFGAVKAVTNLAAGRLADRVGRKRLLVLGWALALPLPFALLWAPSWGWIVGANVLLGVHQGLAWSMTVIMKVDLVGPRRRGLALGLNEAAGYSAVALAAFVTGLLAQAYGPRSAPFLPGFGFASIGLLLSAVFVRETTGHVAVEAEQWTASATPSRPTAIWPAFRQVTWRERSLSAASQAGLINNLNDALAWGLLPIFFASTGMSIGRIGVVVAVYPLAWGLGQLATGAMSDRTGRKWPIVAGMWLQAAAIAAMVSARSFPSRTVAALGMGIGTALVYPTLLAVVGDVAEPRWRATALGVYRFWRDAGYAVGALLAGVVADAFGLRSAIATVAALTAVSGLVVAIRMRETLPSRAGG